MSHMRTILRFLWLGLLLLIVASAFSALAATVTVPPSKAADQSFAVDANAVKPAECAGITLDGFGWEVAGRDSGLYYGTAGNDSFSTGKGDDCILAGDGDDSINANAGNDVLLGEGGSDWLIGGVDNDVLYGGAGNDNLDGRGGDDIIYGGDGDDDIDGGGGTDICYGGSGSNTFRRCAVCYNGPANLLLTCP